MRKATHPDDWLHNLLSFPFPLHLPFAIDPLDPQKTDLEGLSGKIHFDRHGNRVNFTIDVVQTTMNSEMAKIAEWDTRKGLVIVPAKYHRVVSDDKNLENKTYIVTSIEVSGGEAPIQSARLCCHPLWLEF